MDLSPTEWNHYLCLFVLCAFAIFAGNGSVVAAEPDTDVIVTTPGTRYSRSAPAGWRGATRSEEKRERISQPTSALTIRVYEGLETSNPYYGDDPAHGIDVLTEIENCPDGNARISVLNIGGWLYEVEGDCAHQGRLVGESPPESATAAGGSEEQVLRCDPETWRCRTIDRSPH